LRVFLDSPTSSRKMASRTPVTKHQERHKSVT